MNEVQITRETRHAVFFLDSNGKEVSENKICSSYYSYHDTEEEAKNYLMEEYNRIISDKLLDIEYYNKEKNKVFNFKLTPNP